MNLGKKLQSLQEKDERNISYKTMIITKNYPKRKFVPRKMLVLVPH